jgi:hypothetical protein
MEQDPFKQLVDIYKTPIKGPGSGAGIHATHSHAMAANSSAGGLPAGPVSAAAAAPGVEHEASPLPPVQPYVTPAAPKSVAALETIRSQLAALTPAEYQFVMGEQHHSLWTPLTLTPTTSGSSSPTSPPSTGFSTASSLSPASSSPPSPHMGPVATGPSADPATGLGFPVAAAPTYASTSMLTANQQVFAAQPAHGVLPQQLHGAVFGAVPQAGRPNAVEVRDRLWKGRREGGFVALNAHRSIAPAGVRTAGVEDPYGTLENMAWTGTAEEMLDISRGGRRDGGSIIAMIAVGAVCVVPPELLGKTVKYDDIKLKFSGGPKVLAFVRSFELLRERYQWTAFVTAAHLLRCLDGEASQVVDMWQSRMTSDANLLSVGQFGRKHWRVLMRALVWFYWDDASQQCARLAFMRIRWQPHESFMTYRYRVDEARYGLDITVDDMLRLMSSDPNLAARADLFRMQNFHSVDEILNTLERTRQSAQELELQDVISGTVLRGNRATRVAVPAVQQLSANGLPSVSSEVAEVMAGIMLMAAERVTRPDQGNVHDYQRQGHYPYQGGQQQVAAQQYGRNCYRCGMEGHVARHCQQDQPQGRHHQAPQQPVMQAQQMPRQPAAPANHAPQDVCVHQVQAADGQPLN